MKYKVVVSHPGRQHVHQLLNALQSGSLLHCFFTTVWDKKRDWRVRMIKMFFPFLRSTFKMRSYSPLDESLIKLNFFPEVVRLVLTKCWPRKSTQWVFLVDRWHDRHVSRKLRSMQYDIFLGYENSCYRSLKTAKRQGRVTIMDLAQVHHSMIGRVRTEFSSFRSVIDNEWNFEKNNVLKEKEITYVDYFFVLSELARQSLIVAKIEPERIYKVNLGFDPQSFSIKKTYRTNVFTILFVGSITRRKGVQLLIQAFQELSLPNAVLDIVGPIADAADCVKDLPTNITYTPFTAHAELVRHYQQADVFVFPSFLDSWAMVVLEAMACGTPVIISDNTGAKDAVAQGGGFIIPTGDLEQLKEKITYFYENEKERESIGRVAHQIAQQYTWKNYYTGIQHAVEDVYRKTHIKQTVE